MSLFGQFEIQKNYFKTNENSNLWKRHYSNVSQSHSTENDKTKFQIAPVTEILLYKRTNLN